MSETDPDYPRNPEVPLFSGLFSMARIALGYGLIIFFLVCTGLIIPIVQVVWMLGAGWYFFLMRSSSEIHVSPRSLIWFAVCLALLVQVTHQTAQWLMTAQDSENAPVSERQKTSWPFLRTCKLLAVVLSSFLAGVFLVGITHEMTWMMTSKEPIASWDLRGPARRFQSKNNLKMLGLAFHNYNDSQEGFPESMTWNEHGQVRESWMTALLPFIDRANLLRQIKSTGDLHWSAPENRKVFQTELMEFINPAIPERTDSGGYAFSHYSGNNLVLQPGRKRPMKEIADGTSNTVLAGEVNSQFQPWGKPGNCRDLRLGINKVPDGFGSPFRGGAQFLLVDGSVRFISENIDPKILNALATPAGGEPVGDF